MVLDIDSKLYQTLLQGKNDCRSLESSFLFQYYIVHNYFASSLQPLTGRLRRKSSAYNKQFTPCAGAHHRPIYFYF